MSVSKIRLTARTLIPAMQKAAMNSSNVAFIPPLEKRSMAGMMTFMQALMCLQKGKPVGKPMCNEYGDWELTMRRFSANHDFELKVLVKCNGISIEKIYAFPGLGD